MESELMARCRMPLFLVGMGTMNHLCFLALVRRAVNQAGSVREPSRVCSEQHKHQSSLSASHI